MFVSKKIQHELNFQTKSYQAFYLSPVLEALHSFLIFDYHINFQNQLVQGKIYLQHQISFLLDFHRAISLIQLYDPYNSLLFPFLFLLLYL